MESQVTLGLCEDFWLSLWMKYGDSHWRVFSGGDKSSDLDLKEDPSGYCIQQTTEVHGRNKETSIIMWQVLKSWATCGSVEKTLISRYIVKEKLRIFANGLTMQLKRIKDESKFYLFVLLCPKQLEKRNSHSLKWRRLNRLTLGNKSGDLF